MSNSVSGVILVYAASLAPIAGARTSVAMDSRAKSTDFGNVPLVNVLTCARLQVKKRIPPRVYCDGEPIRPVSLIVPA